MEKIAPKESETEGREALLREATEHTKKLWDKADKILYDLSFMAPEDVDMRRTKVVNQLILATSPLVQIHALMSGTEWTPGTLDDIAAILRQSGFGVEEV